MFGERFGPHAVAGLNSLRTFRQTFRKNLITRGRIQKENTSPAAMTTNTTIGRNIASRIVTTAKTSSARLTTMFETGSGLVLISARVAALVPCELKANPPPNSKAIT